LIEVEGVTKRYGQRVAVDNISFTVNDGEILGFLGPNGAGKSTTMNIITGYISATEGTVRIDGKDILDQPEEAKKDIGYLPEFPPLYLDMTVSEYLNFICDIRKVPQEERKQSIDKIMDVVKILDVKDRLIKNLSKGYKQRVGLAQAMVGNPKVLVLDEPTVGLDPRQIIEMRDLIKKLGRSHTIILSSHILPEVSAICDRIIIINKGKIVASGTPANLSKRLGGGRLSLRIAASEKQAADVLSQLPGIIKIDLRGSFEPGTVDMVIEPEEDVDIRRPVFNALSRAGYPILMMRPMDLSLEEIFMQVTTQESEVN